MGEALIVLLVLAALFAVLAVPIVVLLGWTRTRALSDEVRALEGRLRRLEARFEKGGPIPAVAAPSVVPAAPEPPPLKPPSPRPAAVPLEQPEAPPSAPSPPLAPAPPPRAPLPRSTAVAAPPQPIDFATFGPKLLVAGGALAVFASLAFFVKYAWENEWVGPTGRVLSGATFSLGLIALGLRLLKREYRPLGQGLAGAGFAGLYTALFGAHGFYDLIPRGAAGLLLVGVTAAALLLASRLDLRLLAALAWIGGYLTPALLSTGEDRALGLFAYLFLLDAGALVLDRRKPWPETMPLAFAGTMVLYAGWWGQHYTPQKFVTAALGLVLFTALFALGPAAKQRGVFQAFVVTSASIITLAMSDVGAGPGPVLLSLAIGLLALRFAGQWGTFFRLLAGFVLFVPFLAWVNGYTAERFLTGAIWVLGAVLTFALGDREKGGSAVGFRAGALLVGGLCAAGLAAQTDAPALVTALLLAIAAIAALLRSEWAWSETTGLATATIAILAWRDHFHGPEAHRNLLLMAIAVSGAYLLCPVVRGVLFRRELGSSGVALHLGAAALLWGILFDVLYDSNPLGLGFVSLALAALYLAIGLVLRAQEPRDALHVRTSLGLAAAFVTIAIPVQLGLHGITLAWTVWALLLLGLGRRFDSPQTRAFGYAVLGLATLRLFARHLPLHTEAFTPVLNASFGIWLCVCASLGLALRVTRRAGAAREPLEAALHPPVASAALVLLFGLLTGETNAHFDALARAGDESARLMGGLAISVLWSVYAMALLAAGLGLRNRAVFYAAYGLFGIAALKVVLVDLAELHTIYRILSFLALGVLLMVGAWLHIRFRARLLPRAETAR